MNSGLGPLGDGLLQERVGRDEHYPWRVMVCCVLLNQTASRQARPAAEEIFRRCPGPEHMLFAQLNDVLRPLGLQRRRARLPVRMTADYLAGVPAEECHGVGQYARDALALFVDGRTDVDPSDHWLRPYLEWRKRDERNNKAPRWGGAAQRARAQREPVRRAAG